MWLLGRPEIHLTQNTTDNIFFIFFFLTISATRLVLFLCPVPSPTIRKVRLHHWMFGIGLLVASIIFANHVLFAIGLALFVDELTFLIIKGRTHKDNYSAKSMVGTIVFVILAYIFREQLFGSSFWP